MQRTSHRRLLRHLALLVLMLSATQLSSASAQSMCVACHSNQDFLVSIAGDSTAATSLLVEPAEFQESIHGKMGFGCKLCHSAVGDYPHGPVAAVDCGGCHPQEAAEIAASIHGQTHPETGEAAATCGDCHTHHHILGPSDPSSSVYRLTQFEVCATCHEDAEKMRRFGQENVSTVASYVSSVHGRALLEKGLSVAPVCTDCHGPRGAHSMLVVTDSACIANRCRVGETCGACHAGIMARYARGVHGTEFAAGNFDAPTCVDCHAEHGVEPVTSPTSHVSPQHVAQTCIACHDSEEFNEKYGVSVARGRTFDRSFHGVALESGQLTAANCESCHGAHEILPSSDSTSRIHPANLQATCGGCHPGIGKGVTQGRIHIASIVDERSLVGKGVQWFYIIVIAITIVYALGLIALDQYRFWAVDRPRHGGRHA